MCHCVSPHTSRDVKDSHSLIKLILKTHYILLIYQTKFSMCTDDPPPSPGHRVPALLLQPPVHVLQGSAWPGHCHLPRCASAQDPTHHQQQQGVHAQPREQWHGLPRAPLSGGHWSVLITYECSSAFTIVKRSN